MKTEKFWIHKDGYLYAGDYTEGAREATPEEINNYLGLTIDSIKQNKWNEIKAERDRREQSGVSYMGKVLDSDTLSVQRISIAVQAAQAVIAAGQEFAIDWTCQDNTTLTMTAEQVVEIPVALAQYSNSLHQTARELREQIEEATTEEELAAIKWPD